MRYFYLILLICLPCSAFSQQLWGGVKAGTAVPTVGEWFNIGNYSALKGAHDIGITLDFMPTDKRYFINSGISTLTSGENTFLQVPLTADVYFGKKLKGYLILGIYNTFRFQASKERYKSFDFGLNYGLGLEYPINPSFRIFGEYKLYYGIIPFERDLNYPDDPYYTMDYAFLQLGIKLLLFGNRNE